MMGATPVQLFAAAGHVVDEGSIDIGAADTDRIEERFKVGDEIFLVGEFLSHHLIMAGIAQHDESA
ncbi:MAG: hypothetical protein AB7P19_09265 [Nitrospira sp.]